MSIFRSPTFSDWRIAGSAGVDVQVETPVVNLAIGGGYLQLPLENTKTKAKLTLHMAGGEVGLGVGESLFGIVDIEGSISAFPSDGIGKIVLGPRGRNPVGANDFVGNRAMIASVGYKVGGGWSMTAIAFIKRDIISTIGSAVIPGPADDLMWSHAAGLFYGFGMGAGASIGVKYAEFVVVSVV